MEQCETFTFPSANWFQSVFKLSKIFTATDLSSLFCAKKSTLVISSRSKPKFMKNNHGLLNELLQLYFCMCLNFDRKCSKWPWLPHWYLPHVVFCILFHIFQLLINFTEGPNITGFLPPQLPHSFHYSSIFHSSFFLQHNHPFGYWLLFSFHTFP